MKTVFTTGEAAKVCKVSQQTIIRCFDNGQLKGFRVPGSRFRRIPRDSLYRFMKDNGIPLEALTGRFHSVLIADSNGLAEQVSSRCTEQSDEDEEHKFALEIEDARFLFEIVATSFELAMRVRDSLRAVVIGTLPGAPKLKEMVRSIRQKHAKEQLVILVTADAAGDELEGLTELDVVAVTSELGDIGAVLYKQLVEL